jgi:hypothetical protein
MPKTKLPLPKSAPKRPAAEPLNFRRLYRELAIDKADQPTVTDCLTLGLASFHEHIYGTPVRRGLEQLASRLNEPYIFGFGAVEVARNPSVSIDTRLKFTEQTMRSFDATAEYGIPHGLPILASFLAQIGVLEPDVMRTLLITADFAGAMFDDWQIEEVEMLFSWLVDRVDMPKAERLWWLWQITVNCEDTRMSRHLAQWILDHDEIGIKSKKTLCKAWLNDTAPGEPPPQWEALQALLQGDVKGYMTHAAEAGVEADSTFTSAEIEADYDAALDALIDENDEDGDPPAMPLQLLRKTLVGPLGDVVYTPGILKHLAIVALPTLGEDPVEVSQTYLGEENRPHGATFNLGVAAVLRAHQSKIPRPVQRKLVARGLKVGGVATRRAFYRLGVELFGDDFRLGARRDEAKSIRDWARKKTKSTKR